MASEFAQELRDVFFWRPNQLPKLQLHRFHASFSERDVCRDKEDPYYVIPPSPDRLVEPGQPIVGVSFFLPIDSLFNPAHQFLVERAGVKQCHITAPNGTFPEKLGIIQDTPYRVEPSGDLTQYPKQFAKMSIKQDMEFKQLLELGDCSTTRVVA
ncbi:hypothetical protein CEUSTIGMA_g1328.t1 [Chlamydomonas eustigma]|uniref:Uncharacterized protein n=1 Tax=Chlamydomonas eustigma TaxID=1157962 RepID=A0A250WSR0_9CHLO|nr:hypothetical protein CEUSTIGMA_g1328.t1 [Chlamydomonas eustigma]|eukprot:GAX73878.1 hypothetical protein CEUSTIGMA_g1328.t1 [Chlamydomonas eustigma]